MPLENAAVAFEGKTIQFHIDNPNDHIQSFHRRGQFYELRQLLSHRDLISMDSTVVDVGANIGNHTMFYAWHTYAKAVYPIEPNQRSMLMLDANIRANPPPRANIDCKYLGVAAGSRKGAARSTEISNNNLGAAKLLPVDVNDQGTIPVIPLDSMEFDGSISFIKIDVEGMELAVLSGAENILKKHRPAVAIEIFDQNESDFWSWTRSAGYQVVHSFAEYLRFKNYILIPRC